MKQKKIYIRRIGKLEDKLEPVSISKVEFSTNRIKILINHHQMDEVNSKIYKEKLSAIEEATKDKDER